MAPEILPDGLHFSLFPAQNVPARTAIRSFDLDGNAAVVRRARAPIK
jgi:hypothetical protein